uniref:Uncharacterized protein n=1 Tax=Knipowitschia caucasica TaxID=637954 RepID=A0AAV2LN83_KNICA
MPSGGTEIYFYSHKKAFYCYPPADHLHTDTPRSSPGLRVTLLWSLSLTSDGPSNTSLISPVSLLQLARKLTAKRALLNHVQKPGLTELKQGLQTPIGPVLLQRPTPQLQPSAPDRPEHRRSRRCDDKDLTWFTTQQEVERWVLKVQTSVGRLWSWIRTT